MKKILLALILLALGWLVNKTPENADATPPANVTPVVISSATWTVTNAGKNNQVACLKYNGAWRCSHNP